VLFGSTEIGLILVIGARRTHIRVAARPSLDLSLHYAASTRKRFYTLATGWQGLTMRASALCALAARLVLARRRLASEASKSKAKMQAI
jgi:hypothetical protein